MTRWSINPILGNYLLALIVPAALMLLLFIGPSYRRISRWRQGCLIALRILVILLLLVVLLRPTIVTTTKKEQSSLLILLVDISRSMTLPSATSGITRWQAQLDALKAAANELKDSGPNLEVRTYTYAEQLQVLAGEPGGWQLPEQPVGDQTDIGSTLYEGVRQELGKRLAGVILLGDGAQTAFAPKVEISEAGRELARLNCPLYTVVFGQPGDLAQSRDVAIESMPEQYSVFVKNELPVRGTLRVRGYANQEIPVELLVEKTGGKAQSIGSAKLTAREDGQVLPVELTFVPDQPGQYKLTLRALQQPGELVTRNNELSAFVTVLEGGLRTLYLYGGLFGEQRLLRRAIDQSPDIQLDDVYLDPNNRSQWPLNLSEHFSNPNFDALLIEDVDAAALSETAQRAITAAVERGRGMMMIGGFHSFGAGGYYGKPLADVLPITIERFERQDFGFDKPVIRDLHIWGELTMNPVRPHAVTRLATEDRNQEVWKSLPPLTGANRFRGLKPRAQVLLETPSQDALLVAGEYGQGRVLAFAGDSTHRWWQEGRQAEFRRFWRQVILWLAKRDEVERNDVWIQLAQRRFPVHSRVTFTAGAKSPTGDPLTGATYTAELVSPDGSRKPIPLSKNGDEVSGAIDDVTAAGDYLIVTSVAVDGNPAGSAQANFQVLDRDIELSNPAADYDLMSRLALQTKEAGGRPVSAEELPRVLEEIKQRQEASQVEVETKWQLGDTSADSWLFLFVFAGVLTTEWFLRKRWGLV